MLHLLSRCLYILQLLRDIPHCDACGPHKFTFKQAYFFTSCYSQPIYHTDIIASLRPVSLTPQTLHHTTCLFFQTGKALLVQLKQLAQQYHHRFLQKSALFAGSGKIPAHIL